MTERRMTAWIIVGIVVFVGILVAPFVLSEPTVKVGATIITTYTVDGSGGIFGGSPGRVYTVYALDNGKRVRQAGIYGTAGERLIIRVRRSVLEQRKPRP